MVGWRRTRPVLAERNRRQAENASLGEQVEQLNQDLAQTQQRLAEGEGQYQALAQAHQETQEKLQEREKSIAVAQEKIQALTAALQKAEAKMEGLRNENQVLAQEKAAIEGQFKQWQDSYERGQEDTKGRVILCREALATLLEGRDFLFENDSIFTIVNP